MLPAPAALEPTETKHQRHRDGHSSATTIPPVNRILGSDLNEDLIGGDGNDSIDGRGGNDSLFGGAGDDSLLGGSGNDTLDGGSGADTLDGGIGNDLFLLGGSAQVATGGAGSDIFRPTLAQHFKVADFTIADGDRIDVSNLVADPASTHFIVLEQSGSNVEVYLDPGNGAPFALATLQNLTVKQLSNASFTGAQLYATSGKNLAGTSADEGLVGDAGNDTVHGAAGADELHGGLGDDALYGDDGNDSLYGEAGSDTLTGGGGDDLLDGGSGNNVLSGGAGNDVLTDSAGTDGTLVADGGDGNDVIDTNLGAATVTGGAGDDSVTDHAHQATIDAGAGNDVVDLSLVPAGALIDVTLGAGSDKIMLPTWYQNAAAAQPTVTVRDFKAGAGGDIIANNFVLTGVADGANPWGASGHLHLAQSGKDTLVQVDVDGPFRDFQRQTVAILSGVDASTLTADNIEGGFVPFVKGTTKVGTDGADLIELTADEAADSVSGGAGNDTLSGSLSDQLDGGSGDDVLTLAVDTPASLTANLDGGAGDDKLVVNVNNAAAGGTITLHGGTGIDQFAIQSQSNLATIEIVDFETGPTGDKLSLGTDHNPFGGEARFIQRGADTVLQRNWDVTDPTHFVDLLILRNIKVANLSSANILEGYSLDGKSTGLDLPGTKGNDKYTDSLGADKLNGAAGDDTLVSSLGGTDQLNGGPGNDVLTMRAPSAGTLDGGAGNDTLTAVLMPNVLEVGGDGNDQLLVNAGGGILSGGAGNDTLTAQDSDNVLLDGGDGNDTFINQGSRHTSATGGPGRDNFKLGTYYEINDFATGANGDIVVLPTDVLANGDPFGPNGKLILVQDGADALIQLNDDLLAPSTLARLHNVDPARLTLDNNNLRVDWHFHSSLPSNGADRLLGTQDGETIDAGTGSDTLIGGGGDDLLVGGAGTDTARYLGNSANFTVTRDDGGLHLLDRTGVEGTDTLVGIERLQFADKAVALDVDGAAGQAYRLYRAAFDRAPDAAGLGFWIAAIDQGRSLKSIAGGFIGSSEFSNLYSGDSTNARVVDHLYQNVLHRTPDAAGRTFWIGVLDAHTATLPEVLVALSESGENTQAVAELIGLGVDYTPYNG